LNNDFDFLAQFLTLISYPEALLQDFPDFHELHVMPSDDVNTCRQFLDELYKNKPVQAYHLSLPGVGTTIVIAHYVDFTGPTLGVALPLACVKYNYTFGMVATTDIIDHYDLVLPMDASLVLGLKRGIALFIKDQDMEDVYKMAMISELKHAGKNVFTYTSAGTLFIPSIAGDKSLIDYYTKNMKELPCLILGYLMAKVVSRPTSIQYEVEEHNEEDHSFKSICRNVVKTVSNVFRGVIGKPVLWPKFQATYSVRPAYLLNILSKYQEGQRANAEAVAKTANLTTAQMLAGCQDLGLKVDQFTLAYIDKLHTLLADSHDVLIRTVKPAEKTFSAAERKFVSVPGLKDHLQFPILMAAMLEAGVRLDSNPTDRNLFNVKPFVEGDSSRDHLTGTDVRTLPDGKISEPDSRNRTNLDKMDRHVVFLLQEFHKAAFQMAADPDVVELSKFTIPATVQPNTLNNVSRLASEFEKGVSESRAKMDLAIKEKKTQIAEAIGGQMDKTRSVARSSLEISRQLLLSQVESLRSALGMQPEDLNEETKTRGKRFRATLSSCLAGKKEDFKKTVADGLANLRQMQENVLILSKASKEKTVSAVVDCILRGFGATRGEDGVISLPSYVTKSNRNRDIQHVLSKAEKHNRHTLELASSKVYQGEILAEDGFKSEFNSHPPAEWGDIVDSRVVEFKEGDAEAANEEIDAFERRVFDVDNECLLSHLQDRFDDFYAPLLSTVPVPAHCNFEIVHEAFVSSNTAVYRISDEPRIGKFHIARDENTTVSGVCFMATYQRTPGICFPLDAFLDKDHLIGSDVNLHSVVLPQSVNMSVQVNGNKSLEGVVSLKDYVLFGGAETFYSLCTPKKALSSFVFVKHTGVSFYGSWKHLVRRSLFFIPENVRTPLPTAGMMLLVRDAANGSLSAQVVCSISSLRTGKGGVSLQHFVNTSQGDCGSPIVVGDTVVAVHALSSNSGILSNWATIARASFVCGFEGVRIPIDTVPVQEDVPEQAVVPECEIGDTPICLQLREELKALFANSGNEEGNFTASHLSPSSLPISNGSANQSMKPVEQVTGLTSSVSRKDESTITSHQT